MLYELKKLIRKRLHAAGWELHRYRPSSDAGAMLAAMLDSRRVDLVLDVGANRGQFAREIRAAGYRGTILSVEPLEHAHSELERVAAFDPLWQVATRGAAGATEAQMQINVSANSVSSSMLPASARLRASAPGAAYIAQQMISVRRLDDIAAPALAAARAPFIKIDTQGFEWQVLDGATTSLDRAVGLCVEASLVSLYEGQRLWFDVIERIEGIGFEVWGVHPAFGDPTTGRTLQVDVFFTRA